MSKRIGYLFAFAVGVAAGSFATWKYIQTKYEQIAREEIESIREVYRAKKLSDTEEETKDEKPEESEDDDSEYFVYEDMTSEYTSEKGGSEPTRDDPYLIAPGDFASLDDYEIESLLYFADGVLTDDAFLPIDNIESLVVPDFSEHFGDYDYDQDTVYVRNDRLKTDYEILRDEREYSKVVGPHDLNLTVGE